MIEDINAPPSDRLEREIIEEEYQKFREAIVRHVESPPPIRLADSIRGFFGSIGDHLNSLRLLVTAERYQDPKIK